MELREHNDNSLAVSVTFVIVTFLRQDLACLVYRYESSHLVDAVTTELWFQVMVL